MRVFLHEFITSGALTDLPMSLLQEGRAMRTAVAQDLAALPDVSVVTTHDRRLAPLTIPGVEDVLVSSPAEEREQFRRLLRECDLSCIIAPEIDGELARRIEIANECRRSSGQGLNVSPTFARLAGDKWATYCRLKQAGVPTIETELATCDSPRWWPVVVKPRDGAGSMGIGRLDECDRWTALTEQEIVQPLIRGRALSCTVIYDRRGEIVEVCPPAEQTVDDDRGFAYRGGQVPARAGNLAAIQALAARAVEALRGAERVIGPIGVDLIEEAETGRLLAVEINPRFTTSYVGLRQLADSNLLARIFDADSPRIQWRDDFVVFSSDGQASTLFKSPTGLSTIGP